MFIAQALAQGASASGTTTPESGLMSFLPLLLMFVVLYFVMIRPQMKRQKTHRDMLAALANGDEVVTSGGLVGKVTRVGETYIHLEVAQGVVLHIQKNALTTLLPKGTIKGL